MIPPLNYNSHLATPLLDRVESSLAQKELQKIVEDCMICYKDDFLLHKLLHKQNVKCITHRQAQICSPCIQQLENRCPNCREEEVSNSIVIPIEMGPPEQLVVPALRHNANAFFDCCCKTACACAFTALLVFGVIYFPHMSVTYHSSGGMP